MKENNKIWVKPLIYLYLVTMTAIVAYFSSKLWLKELWPHERFTVVVVSTSSFCILLLAFSIKLKDLTKLMILYHGVILFTVLVMLIPYEYRPIMAVFMIITLFAGLDTGLISVLGISVAVSFLYGAEQEYLYGTLIIGAFSCFVAYFSKDRPKLWISIVIFMFGSFFINDIFQYYVHGEFYLEDVKFALLSLTSVIISVIIFINVYMYIRPRSVEPYIREDSETVLAIKETSLSLYYHSVEVAELSGAAAGMTGCDKRLAYGGGMLHDIGKIRSTKDYVKEGLVLANEYGLPKEIKAIIVEHNGKHRLPSSKESAIVMLADSVISSIEHLKSSDREVSEKKIIDNVCSVKMLNGALDKAGLSVQELSLIRMAFQEYYSRRERGAYER